MSKIAFIFYSGGKDAHLALLYALKKKYEPFLIILNGGAKHKKIFNDINKTNILKEQAKLMNCNFIVKKVNNINLENILNILKKEVKKRRDNKIALFFSNDYQNVKKDIITNNKIKNFCDKFNIKFISFLNIIKKDDTYASIKKSIKEKIKSIIVGLDEGLDENWIGKELNIDFLNYLKFQNKDEIKFTAENYQTLVVSSKILPKNLKILKYNIISDKINKISFLNIRKYKWE